jgi:catechol 2,3-dioxygenase-like lactoylglutathione lyase family enzyme
MTILGIETAIFGVEDLAQSTQYLTEFGLPLQSKSATETHFRMEEGSNVILRNIDDPSLPRAIFQGSGARETIWGVDSAEELERLVDGLTTDRDVRRDADGSAHFYSDCGMALGLRAFNRKRFTTAADPLNGAASVARLNQHRKWYQRAIPKAINHIVFSVVDYQASFGFFRDRLGFRMSDHSRGLGIFARCDGRNEHHNIFFQKADFFAPDAKPKFEHLCFAVEDIDEMMVGANHMERLGWKSVLGVGRHRIASALFYYIPSPLGGEMEYGADTDYIDDNWIPREWDVMFGYMTWAANPPPFLPANPSWDVRIAPEFAHQRKQAAAAPLPHRSAAE